MKPLVLLIEPQKIISQTMQAALSEYDILHVTTAADAVVAASDTDIEAVITELSLSGHSGFEFLYEFRSYADWQAIPIIVYSTVKLSDDILSSRSWQALRIHDYLYKPASSLADLSSSLEKATAQVEA